MVKIKTVIEWYIEWYEEQDRKYPNRHKEIHKTCCKNCPSNHNKINSILDPETEDYKALPKEVLAREYVFVCAWRPSKLCKGICDEYGIDEVFVKSCRT